MKERKMTKEQEDNILRVIDRIRSIGVDLSSNAEKNLPPCEGDCVLGLVNFIDKLADVLDEFKSRGCLQNHVTVLYVLLHAGLSDNINSLLAVVTWWKLVSAGMGTAAAMDLVAREMGKDCPVDYPPPQSVPSPLEEKLRKDEGFRKMMEKFFEN